MTRLLWDEVDEMNPMYCSVEAFEAMLSRIYADWEEFSKYAQERREEREWQRGMEKFLKRQARLLT